MNADSTKREGAAIKLASKRWREAAVHIRGELRAFGVKGELRLLNDFASGHRGRIAARHMYSLVAEAHEGGLPAHLIEADLGALITGIIADVYGKRVDGVA